MTINDRSVDQAFSDLRRTCGGVRNDYFGLLYLEQEFDLERDQAISQVAFGGNDYGIDGFHVDARKGNLYLLQFKYSASPAQFASSFERLTRDGIERVFGAKRQDQHQNQLLLQIRSALIENQKLIERVLIHFVFTGDPEEAERSSVLDRLREDLENKKYLVDQWFGREITFVIEFRSAKTRKVGSTAHLRTTHRYEIELGNTITSPGPNGEVMTIGLISLSALNGMYKEMGQRFFERNIRASLAEEKAVNRSLIRTLKSIVLEDSTRAEAFTFHHNGVTLAAQALTKHNEKYAIVEPRLLNGAQTVSTFSRFLASNERNPRLDERKDVLDSLTVLCRVITCAEDDFVTAVTISNNRQNPVNAWNLHANDMIQLQLQDKFKDDLGIYYERQEKAFTNLSEEELLEQGIDHRKAIELTLLAKTFLASDGDLDKFARFKEVFEEERIYKQVFSEKRLRADSRHIVLCYKAQFRLRRISHDIIELGANKYAYLEKQKNLLWALLCQAILNASSLETHAERFGAGLSLEAQYTDWLSSLATKQCRHLLKALTTDDQYKARAQEGDFNFMRTNAAYNRAMELAHEKWGWVVKRLSR